MSSTWIFQGNPDVFNIMGYLCAGLDRITWTVTRYADRIEPGDLVFLWQAAGTKKAPSGIVASATVISPVWVGPDHEESLPFWVHTDEANGEASRVWLKVDRVARAKEIIQRAWLLNDPICRDLLILRQAAGTNYPLESKHIERLGALWERTGEHWSRDECIAALIVYVDTLDTELSKIPGSPVANLALLTGRAVGGAYNKVLNFRALDPRDSRLGLSGGGAMDRQVWGEFYDDAQKELKYHSLLAEYDRLWKNATPVKAADDTPLGLGTRYRTANEDLEPNPAQPGAPDPDAVGRGWKAHARTQNALAKFVRDLGVEPCSPRFEDPQFDLCWDKDGTLFVAEVKSTTPSNQEKQLRLGLGQVLRYRQLTALDGKGVRAVLAIEKAPSDSRWVELCASLDVLLVWPEVFADHLK